MKLFKSKKQVEKLKAIEKILPEATIIETTQLKLAELRVVYSISQRQEFQATVKYYERPTDWGNQGTSKEITLTANSWSELIDKVLEHFKPSEDK